MVDKRRLYTPGIGSRIAAMLRSGVDPYAYTVSASKLREVIRAAEASAALKERLIDYLEQTVIQARQHVSCVLLGMAISDFTEATGDEQIINISFDIKNLDKLPYTCANGKAVN
jgi:DNA polymerase III sliding clamp (beta) subunit (PCNA family)